MGENTNHSIKRGLVECESPIAPRAASNSTHQYSFSWVQRMPLQKKKVRNLPAGIPILIVSTWQA
jgi:hypothetical protein